MITDPLHFGMVIVGLDYGHAGQMTLDEITGGSPYGATTIAGRDGSGQPTVNELQGARYQGRKVAEVANELHGGGTFLSLPSLRGPPFPERSSLQSLLTSRVNQSERFAQ